MMYIIRRALHWLESENMRGTVSPWDGLITSTSTSALSSNWTQAIRNKLLECCSWYFFFWGEGAQKRRCILHVYEAPSSVQIYFFWANQKSLNKGLFSWHGT